MWYENIKKKEIGYHVQKDGVHVFLDNNAKEITRTYWPDIPERCYCNYLNEVTTSYQNGELEIESIQYSVQFTTNGLLYSRDVYKLDGKCYLTACNVEYIFVDYEEE